MKSSFFDLRDLAGVARASIPWTPVVIIAPERQIQQNMMRRTREVQEQDLYDNYMNAVQVARAARAVYFAEAIGDAAAAVKAWYRRLRGIEASEATEPAAR